MKTLNNDERTMLLRQYLEIEPKIVVNCESYTVTFAPADDGITFYAISDWMQDQGAVYVLPLDYWESINCGLTMSVFYDRILQTLERRIRAS